MKNLLLTKIRLSVYFWFFFVVFFVASEYIHGTTFAAGPLTLFSVNSFLYGFYISPILGAQKSRIDALHQIIRSEANALFDMVLNFKKLPKQQYDDLKQLVTDYVHAKLRQRKADAGEAEYEKIITYCVDYKGEAQDKIDGVLQDLVSNQLNRTNFNMQRGNKVFTNEWYIMAILFSITLGFILCIQIPNQLIYHVVRALLCTGLTMLIVNLVKLNSLTHKKAKQMWQPLKKLVDTNFYRID